MKPSNAETEISDDEIKKAADLAGGLVEVILDFGEDLEAARDCLRTAKGDPVQRLWAYNGAVAAAIKLVNRLEGLSCNGYHEPLLALQMEITTVLQNIPSSDFQVKPTKRPSEEMKLRHFKFRCAVSMEMYMRAGLSRKEASESVARHLHVQRPKPETVADWRDKLSASRNDFYADRFMAVKKTLPPSGAKHPSGVIERLDNQVRKISEQCRGIKLVSGGNDRKGLAEPRK